MFHEHLKRATGKAAAPDNLQASETHLLIYALQVPIHHLLPFVMYKACCSGVHPCSTSYQKWDVLCYSSGRWVWAAQWQPRYPLSMLFEGTREASPFLATEHGILNPVNSLCTGTAQCASAVSVFVCIYSPRVQYVCVNVQWTQSALCSSLTSSNAVLVLTFHLLVSR